MSTDVIQKTYDYATNHASTFMTPTGDMYARIDVNGHTEIYPTDSAAFKQWLQRGLRKNEKLYVGLDSIKNAVSHVESETRFSGVARENVYIRIAPGMTEDTQEPCIWLDLGDDSHTAIRITAHELKSVQNPPVNFYRPGALLPLPMPVDGGDIQDLRTFLCLTGNEHEYNFVRCMGWLSMCFNPFGPYPILVLCGERGALKTPIMRYLRAIIDPSGLMEVGEIKNTDHLMVTCKHTYVLAIDNRSYIPQWLSDDLCQIAIGGGISKRKNYSDSDATVINVKRPIAINGISNIAERGDLLDCSFVLNLTRIPDDVRRPETELWAEFHAQLPYFLYHMCRTAALSLRDSPTVSNTPYARMADAHKHIRKSEQVYTVRGTFDAALAENERVAIGIEIESSLVAAGVLKYMSYFTKKAPEKTYAWNGYSSVLYDLVAFELGDKTKSKSWPRDAPRFGRELALCRTALAKVGLSIETEHREYGTYLWLTYTDKPDSADSKNTTNGLTGQSNGVFEGEKKLSPEREKLSPSPGMGIWPSKADIDGLDLPM